MKIKAALAKEKNYPLVIEEIEIDEPKEDEVLIRIVASGICHTDAESIKGNGAPFPAVEPYRVCRRPSFLRECPDEKSKIYP